MPNHFHGRVEGTNIVIDNCGSKDSDGCYFLISHPHTDHTGGLTEKFNKGAIHCSTLCKELLLMRFPLIQQHNPIIGHHIGSTFTLSELQSPERRGLKSRRKQIKNTNSDGHDTDSEDEWRCAQSNGVEITLIDANHCPGSVMFLIRNTNGKIYLHTGDYRTSDDMLNNPLLTNVWIDIVYMDCTFCHPSLVFPTKKRIALEVAQYIKQKKKDKAWKKKHHISFKIVYIDAKQLGVEPFLVELCQIFDTKIWANSRSWQYKNLSHFPNTSKYITLDQNDALFHIAPNGISFAEFVKRDRKHRKENHLTNVIYISPTTMFFALRNICCTPIKYTENDGITHVLYSMHSDYNEMRRFISKLNVKQVMPFNDPFIPGKGRDNNFPSVTWVRSQFKDCIEKDTTESRDIFEPKLNGNISTSSTENHNVHSCAPTAMDKVAQNDKMIRILQNLQQNKHRETQYEAANVCKSSPKRVNTAPAASKIGAMKGAKCQNGWIQRMKQKQNITEYELRPVNKILQSISESTPYRKRKRSNLERNNCNQVNQQPAKKRKRFCGNLSEIPLTPIKAATPHPDFEICGIGISISSSQTNASPLLSCEPKVARQKRSMDIDEDDDNVLDLNHITAGFEGNDDSTINEDSAVQIQYTPYKTFAEEQRRRPYYLSRQRLQDRKVLIYRKEIWNKSELKEILNVIHGLQMKQVYGVFDAKFIVVDSKMMKSDEIHEEILQQIGCEYKNGCHHIREVYCGKLLSLLCKNNYNRMRGTISKAFTDRFEDYFLLSTFDANKQYLKRMHLWPLKPKKCRNKHHL